MAEELQLESLKEIKKADYVKAFKNKAVWKKAKAVIILVDYKLDGKKSVIAIPFRKETEMKAEMKRLKKEKIHILKKSGGGTIEFTKTAEGMSAKVEIQVGGLSTEMLLMKGQPLFDKIKVKLEALQTAEAMAEAAESAAEVDPNENLPEDNFSDVAEEEMDEEGEEVAEDVAEEDASAAEKRIKLAAKKEEGRAAITKMLDNLNKIADKLSNLS
jgi:hypothetical protein